MEINQTFWEAINPALSALRHKIGDDFVVFGSAPLYLYGVLEFRIEDGLNDLDIVVRENFVPSGEMREVLFQDDPRQRLYKIEVGGISVDIGSAWPGREKFYGMIFSSALEVHGFRFASLNVVSEWKEMMVEEYGRSKDRHYLKEIGEFRRRKAETISIVDAAAEDVEEIIKLKDGVWVTTYTNQEYGIRAEDIRSRKRRNPTRIEEMEALIRGERGRGHVWVARDGGTIIGMCAADKEKEKNKLSALYVLPSYQGMGVGTRLLREAVAWLGEEKPVCLGVVEYNLGAIGFYQKMGFILTERRDDHILPNGKRLPVREMVWLGNLA